MIRKEIESVGLVISSKEDEFSCFNVGILFVMCSFCSIEVCTLMFVVRLTATHSLLRTRKSRRRYGPSCSIYLSFALRRRVSNPFISLSLASFWLHNVLTRFLSTVPPESSSHPVEITLHDLIFGAPDEALTEEDDETEDPLFDGPLTPNTSENEDQVAVEFPSKKKKRRGKSV